MAEETVRGVPFTRSYSLEDIGNVPRGSRLGFDRFGRVAVIHDAVYAVLNDGVWLNLAEAGGRDRVPMANVAQAGDGRGYYGARGEWGRVEAGADGLLHPVSLAPANAPGWVAAAVFRELIVTKGAIYFAGWNGVVRRDLASGRQDLFESPRLSRMFRLGEEVYLSSHDGAVHRIDAISGVLVREPDTELEGRVVGHATPFDEGRSLLALREGRVMIFDGRRLSPWLKGEAEAALGAGNIPAILRLVDGRVAIAATGKGIFLFSAEGELLMTLTAPDYRNVTELANREPGVLWAATEDAVEKILYGSPLSTFGQRLGLPVQWPLVVKWRGKVVVASAGKLYAAAPGEPGETTRFAPMETQPPGGAWALAAWGDQLLAGSGSGVYSLENDGLFHSVRSVTDVSHLVMTDARRCFVIGRSEIALLERKDGAWRESVNRIPGVRNPAVVHRVRDSVWIEMGGEGVARLTRTEGRLRLDVIPNEKTSGEAWVNVGSVGDIVVLSSLREEPRRFFDESAGRWVPGTELQSLLERSPHWIARVRQDEDGVIWATHNEGLVRFTPSAAGGHDVDASSFDRVNDRYPVVHVLPGNDVWMSAERSLYHLERDWISSAPEPPRPRLVSLVDLQRNEELRVSDALDGAPLRLSRARNNLSFRFYSGTDAWRRAPVYEYRLSKEEPWTAVDGSLITLRGLRETRHELEVRIEGAAAGSQVSAPFVFEILPPWNRSPVAYVLFGAASLLLLFGASRGSSYLERRRNRRLEQEVRDRTVQLEAAMAKLGEETRNAATLAERDRLAREIHDSVQQGLTGAMLQLDSTLKSPVMSGDLRARLNVVRNMVSYSRQEVEHAVWDMESPLLDGGDLPDALRNLTAFMSSGEVAVDVAISGAPIPLDRAVNHNLLRIAQEASTNAFRHARARRIFIRLEYGAGVVSLEIADDGVGFRPADVLRNNDGHLGLRGMRTRAKKLRGTLEIASAPGEGARLRVVVPAAAGQPISDDA